MSEGNLYREMEMPVEQREVTYRKQIRPKQEKQKQTLDIPREMKYCSYDTR